MTPAGAVPPFDAVIFDMDGVVTDTAQLHAAAWKELFDSVLARRARGSTFVPFDADTDYRRYVDGRTREDGVATFLASRGIAFATGGAEDTPAVESVEALAADKNDRFKRLVAEHGVRAFPSSVALLERLRAGGVRTALVSASRNAVELLTAAGVDGMFDAVVDGTEAARLGLAGKPDPAMFIEAARVLGVNQARAAIVEDAAAGVAAGRAGGFGLVVGVNRGGHRDDLEMAGADLVVSDLGELDLGARRVDPWTLVYEGFDPAHERHREALTALGNGYVATRGADPEHSDDAVHYPGTYIAGLYNRLETRLEGGVVEDEHLVNLPNWLCLDLRSEHGEWWSDGGFVARDERRELDMRHGLLTRRVVLVDQAGRRLQVKQRRLVSMARAHLVALETTLTAEGWQGTVRVRAAIDARVVNANVAEYAALADRHLVPLVAEGLDEQTLIVEAETNQSKVRIAVAARTTVAGAARASKRRLIVERGWAAHEIDVELADGRPVVIDKTVAVVTSRDVAIASPRLAVLTELSRAEGGLEGLRASHEAVWRRLWARFGVDVDVDAETRLILNLHVFHLLQVLSPNTVGLDAGVPARGLHGEGYRGHIFWDELFVLPLLTLRLPAVTRTTLAYRWRRLDAARDAARAAGLEGAMFPWQSGSDGREETPGQLFNERSGRWIPDHSHLQRHVGLAIAHNAWNYYQATGDRDWLADVGAELIIEVARFFTSLATHDPVDDRYHISGVMGPDEYHDAYPDATDPGLRDNAYTNVLAAWVCERAVEVLELLAGHACDDVLQQLAVHPDETTEWAQISRRLVVPFNADGTISQFGGYELLAELDWNRYRATYADISRLDLILEAEGDSPNRYKVAKQADVLMLVYLLGPGELIRTLRRLGYPLTPDTLARTVDYYLSRTAHGSTLSRVVNASVLARIDRSRSWTIFRDALTADLDDTQGGTTGEGIHLGAMAGTIDLVLRAYAGITLASDSLTFDPELPESLHHVHFQVVYRGQRIAVDLDHRRLRLRIRPCGAPPINMTVRGSSVTMTGGETQEFSLHPAEPGKPFTIRD
jgi:beta-phosphoglucomutase family hydrolase